MSQASRRTIVRDSGRASPVAKRVAIVGASLAGLRTLESLRRLGCTDQITVIGDETHRPYNRPPLSKGVLTGEMSTARLALRSAEDPGPTSWILGDGVVESDIAAGKIRLSGGATMDFDVLVAATGLRSRRLPLPGPMAGRYSLRGMEEAEALRKALSSQPRVTILGASFVGCEVAAAARSWGCPTVVVAPERVPLERAMGTEVGELVLQRHLARGVEFRLGTVPVAVVGDGRVTSVLLGDGDSLSADVVVEAVGSQPNIEWLEGNGMDLVDGVRCDGSLRALGQERVVAVGDLVRFPLPLAGGRPMRIEHWQMAIDSARRAARTVLGMLGRTDCVAEPFAPLPSFWSDQYGERLQSFGVPSLGLGDVRVLMGDPEDPRVVGYHDERGLVGVASLGATPAEMSEPRTQLRRRASG